MNTSDLPRVHFGRGLAPEPRLALVPFPQLPASRAATPRARPTPGTAPAAALDLDVRCLNVALLVSIVKENLVGPIAVLALDRSGVEFTSVLELRFAFVPFANLRRALRAPRAAPGPRTTPVAAQDLDPF